MNVWIVNCKIGKMRRRPLPPVKEEVSKTRTWRSLCESDWLVYSVVGLIGALVYANSLDGEFVHDDIPAIVTNGDVNGGNDVWKVFKNDFWGTPMSDHGSHKSYRPFTTLTFRVNYALCGLNPWWWHACNILLHAICCALVARTGALVAKLRKPFDALAALLFAVHPVHTEAVAGIVGRADVLACVFFLSSVLLYHGSSRRHRVWLSIVLAALSMFAKETGLTALMFNLAFDLYKSWNIMCPSLFRTKFKLEGLGGRVVLMLAALAILTSIRLALLQGSLPAFSAQDNPPAFHPCFAVRVMTFCYLAAFNWWLLLCPLTLSHDWQMGSVSLVTSAWDPRNLMTCAAFVGFLVLSYRCLKDTAIQRHTPMVVGFMILVIPYIPASNLLVTVGFVVAERILYIPSVGSVLVTAYGVQIIWKKSHRRKYLLMIGLIILVTTGVVRTHLRNRDWRTREALLRADLNVLPNNAKLHYNYANFLKDIEQQDNAIHHYKEALRLWPSYASAHNNLGTLLIAETAEYHFLEALKYNRDHVNAHYNLAKLYRKNNRLSEAMRMLERCISLEPHFAQAHLEKLMLTAPRDRQPILDTLIELDPSNWEYHLMYGNWYKERGLSPYSINYYEKALKLSFSGDNRESLKGQLVSLRANCLLLRSRGQRARIIQLVVRWYSSRERRTAPQRLLLERAWRLRSELAARAALYAQLTAQVSSTCLDHSQLEVTQNSQEVSRNIIPNYNRKINYSVHSTENVNPVHKNDLQKLDSDIPIKKNTSISSQFKAMNQSESNSCVLSKMKK